MNSGFCRNSLLANTALILLCYIRGIFVHPSPPCKLLSGQTYRHRIPELVLHLPLLSEPHEGTTAKNQFSEIEGNIKPMCQRRERGLCTGSRRRRSRRRELGQECEHPLLIC